MVRSPSSTTTTPTMPCYARSSEQLPPARSRLSGSAARLVGRRKRMASTAAQRFATSGEIVIVGASLAGLYGAEALRKEGFEGRLTLIGAEPYEPYDRPPLSKSVLSGWLSAERTVLPRSQDLNARWLLGTPAAGLDTEERSVRLADDRRVSFDRLLITTGTRARPWP